MLPLSTLAAEVRWKQLLLTETFIVLSKSSDPKMYLLPKIPTLNKCYSNISEITEVTTYIRHVRQILKIKNTHIYNSEVPEKLWKRRQRRRRHGKCKALCFSSKRSRVNFFFGKIQYKCKSYWK